jgi:hypothetical protein
MKDLFKETIMERVRARLNKKTIAIAILAIVVVLFLIPNPAYSQESSKKKFEEDIVATDACTHFKNVYRDTADGVLTDAELREKIKEVNDTASASEVPKIRTAARELLSAVTIGTTDDALAAMANMLAICNNYAEKVSKAEKAQANNPDKNDEDSSCFVATAAYGTPTHSDIDVLRDFRDSELKTNLAGSAFVATYYKVGPIAANFIEDKPVLRTVVREAFIKPIVKVVDFFKFVWS